MSKQEVTQFESYKETGKKKKLSYIKYLTPEKNICNKQSKTTK